MMQSLHTTISVGNTEEMFKDGYENVYVLKEKQIQLEKAFQRKTDAILPAQSNLIEFPPVPLHCSYHYPRTSMK